MRLVIWFIVCVVLVMLFAHALTLARNSLNTTVVKCQQHNAEIADVR